MDSELRRLERAWRASAQESDHLRWIQARLRRGDREEDLEVGEQAVLFRARVVAGDLSRARLAVAAHCGSGEAAAALGVDVPESLYGHGGAPAWCAELERLAGPDALRQVVVILSEAALAMVSFPDDTVAEVLEEALEAWAEAPTGEQLRALADAQRDVEGFRAGMVGTTEAQALEALEELIEAGKLGRWEEVWQASGSLPGRRDGFQGLLAPGLIPWALEPRTPQARPTEVRAYSPYGRFLVGERVAHPAFGEGEVTRATAKQIEVAFGSGTKKLAHGLVASERSD